jgi:hypothetical protein
MGILDRISNVKDRAIRANTYISHIEIGRKEYLELTGACRDTLAYITPELKYTIDGVEVLFIEVDSCFKVVYADK